MRKWLGINWVDIQNTTQSERYKNLLNAGMQNTRIKERKDATDKHNTTAKVESANS